MTEKILYNGKAYAPFLIENGMKRDSLTREEELKVFDYADENGDRILNGNEFNKAICASGHYPGEKNTDRSYYNKEEWNKFDKNQDGEITKEELDEYVNLEVKYELIKEEFSRKNSEIQHHDKESSLLLGGLGLATSVIAKICKNESKKLLPAKTLAENGIQLKHPKFYEFLRTSKVHKYLDNFGIVFGLVVSCLAITDIIMGNNNEKKRNILKHEYSEKMYNIVEENPNSERAKQLYQDFGNYIY